ncbi:MAG: hypothetical protein K0Q79_2327 [Flavipsychrobacter sp.]|jgi:uncharacterized membrane-anchored protein|nr:hypothetical protein [Flavipsychrobacter sp.]
MNKHLAFTLLACLVITGNSYAQHTDSSETERQVQQYIDSVDRSIKYQQGKVELRSVATLDVPNDYKFVPAISAEMIVCDIWGNPRGSDILGMIVKSDFNVSSTDWAFIITYSEDGYVKDEDADKIDYDDLLKEMQKGEDEDNKERVKDGYPPIHLMDWAAKPYYDKEKKVLHWAKKLQFGTDSPTISLNYNVRVLGRKGVLVLNAVGSMDDLDDINHHIPNVLKMASFTEGNQYKDFNPSVDKVAAYTIGGLIAGKLIAKTGLLVLLLKNIKLILLAVFGGFAAFRKRIARLFSRKGKDEPYAAPVQEMPVTEEPQQVTAIEGPQEPQNPQKEQTDADH